MRVLLRSLVLSLSGLSLILNGGVGRLSAADAPESRRVHFTTFDEVELGGTFYPSAAEAGKKDKDSVVVLLHDFKGPTGGGSRQNGWLQLAARLQKEGYAVLTFDFRGFGESKSVSPKFWNNPHNANGIRRKRGAPPASIDQKDFLGSYYITLVNDIAAARAFLNDENDAGNLNASNIIVIGAGQGATLGALWMASECRRQRDPSSDRLRASELPQWGPLTRFDDPEGNDVAAAVWLTISPSLENRLMGASVRSCLVDTAKTAKIPAFFLYGMDDAKAADLATAHLNVILTENGKKMEQKGVKALAVRGTGSLAGSKLLDGKTKTATLIVDYLNRVLEDRGTRVRKERQDKKYAFAWSMPWPTARSVHHLAAKLPGEPVSRPIPPAVMNLR